MTGTLHQGRPLERSARVQDGQPSCLALLSHAWPVAILALIFALLTLSAAPRPASFSLTEATLTFPPKRPSQGTLKFFQNLFATETSRNAHKRKKPTNKYEKVHFRPFVCSTSILLLSLAFPQRGGSHLT